MLELYFLGSGSIIAQINYERMANYFKKHMKSKKKKNVYVGYPIFK